MFFKRITGLWNIKYQKADESDSFLAMSFASSSRLMYLGGGELDDISENSGLDLETRSLCVSSYNEFPGYLIQVHRGAVLVTKPKLDDIAGKSRVLFIILIIIIILKKRLVDMKFSQSLRKIYLFFETIINN